ncbi:nuclear transport factor 2 family protein [Sphingomonas sp. RB3P16]|uniref:nuclear transport factor 2 family protein n=1 Tax=Parasphingomonas frigoris TaxID=3096163 RepID=UPI002FCB3DB3
MGYLTVIVALVTAVSSSTAPPDPEQRVRVADSEFWAAFNACNRTRMSEILSPDVEFYHDKTGATITRSAVVKSLMDGPCGTAGLRVRRESVAGSVSYDPIPGFGAILTGRHRFYAQYKGQAERLDGEARFAVVWQIANGRILIRRVLSYAHGPAHETAATYRSVPTSMLQRYAGSYSSKLGEIVVTIEGDHLHVASGGLATPVFAITNNTFEASGRPLRFEFAEQGNTLMVLVQENGTLAAIGTRRIGG